MTSNIPDTLKGRVLVDNGTIFISSEVTMTADMLSFLSYAGRKGLTEHRTVPAEEFQKLLSRSVTSRTESEVQELAVTLIRDAFESGASDIHIEDHGPFATIQFRRLTMLQPVRQLMGDQGRALIRCIYQTMSTSADAQFSPSERQDGRIVSRDFLPADVHSVRLHTEPLECPLAEGGTGTFLAMRLLYDKTNATGRLGERLHQLGYSERHVRRLEFLSQRSGLVLFSGPTGSGKSTALKHVMECMARENPEKSFMSIEDPPEYPLERVRQTRVRTNGDEDASRGREYRNAIAGAMRSDPDTLMVGEIRFPEAAFAAVDAAQTGHGVWTTIHANSAFGIIQRMVSLLREAHCPDPLGYLCDYTVLAGLVHQRLVPTLCPHCKLPVHQVAAMPEDDELRQSVLPEPVLNRLFRTVDPGRMGNVYVRGPGCDACGHMGFSGLTVAAEVVATDRTMLAHLRAGNMEEAIRHWHHEQSGQSFVDHAIALIEQGVADPRTTEMRLGVPLNFAKAIEDDLLTGVELDQLAGASTRGQ